MEIFKSQLKTVFHPGIWTGGILSGWDIWSDFNCALHMQVLSEFKIFLSVLYVVILRIVKHLMLLLICVMILYIILLWYIDYLITCLSECWVCLLAWGSMEQMHGIPCSPLKGKSVQEWDREQTERGLGYNSGALWSCLVTVSLNVLMLSEYTKCTKFSSWDYRVRVKI